MILRFADLCVPIGLQLLSVAASSDLICPNSSHLRYDKFIDFSTFFFFKSTFVFFQMEPLSIMRVVLRPNICVEATSRVLLVGLIRFLADR